MVSVLKELMVLQTREIHECQVDGMRQEVEVCVATSRTIGVWIQVLILAPKKPLVACFLRENLAKNSEVLCQI